MPSQRVLIIGWDGAPFDLLKPWADKGELPHLSALLARGCGGTLESVMPIVSPAAWTSILTGVRPEVHGVFGFVHPEERTHRPKLTSALDRRTSALWEILSEAGIESAFLWVPTTYPPEPLRGIMVSGMGTPGIYADFTYPKELKSGLLEQFGPKIMEPDIIGRDPEEYLDELLDNIRVQGRAAEYLLSQNSPRLSMVVFTQSDRVQHFFWDQMRSNDFGTESTSRQNAILRVYRELDRVLGDLARALGPDDFLILVSDHGAGPVSREVKVDLLLHELRLLFFENESNALPHIGYLAGSMWSRTMRKASLTTRSRLPRRWVAKLQKISQRGVLSRLREASTDSTTHTIDWDRTELFPIDGSGALYCAAGQENLPAREWESFVEGVASRLLGFRDRETGQRIVKSVHRLPLISGEAVGTVPLLAIDWAEGFFGSLSGSGQGETVNKPSQWPGAGSGLRLSSYHRLNGILAAAGPGIAAAQAVQNASLIDVAPSVLRMLRLGVPSYMQGTDLWEQGDCSLQTVEP